MKFLLRIAAVLLVAFALLPRGPAEHDRLLVVALDGAHRSHLEGLVAEGGLPNLAEVLRGAIAADVLGGSSRDPRGFWHALFSGRPWRSVPSRYLWEVVSDAGLDAAVIGVPNVRGVVGERLIVLPGANEADGFIGDNVGRIVNVASIERDSLGWPYTSARRVVAEMLARLEVGVSSRWIEIEVEGADPRRGAFKVYRLDGDTVYLTPVYRNRSSQAGKARVYVADDPAWTARSSRLSDYYYRHVRDLTADRAALARELASGPWKLVVYVDTLLASVYGADRLVSRTRDAEDAEISAAVRDAYRAVDERVGELVTAAGPRALVVVVGSEPDELLQEERDEARSVATGFLYVAGPAQPRRSDPVEPIGIARIAPTLLHLLGIAPPGETEPMASVLASYPGPPGVQSRPRASARASSQALPMTVDSLRDLGLLSDRAPLPAPVSEPESGDAEALSSGTEPDHP